MHLSTVQLDELRSNLLSQREKLTSVLAGLEKTDPANDEGRVDDNADVQTEAIEDNELVRHESLQRETQVMLDRVNAALERMDAGSYGHTDDGQEIPFERLQIDPTVTTVVNEQ